MKKRHVLFVIENNTVPWDVRVWAEAVAARKMGHDVSVICPRRKPYMRFRERIDGIRIWRHPMAFEGTGMMRFLVEYTSALAWEVILSLLLLLRHRFHVIHAGNPPDHLFVLGLLFKVIGVQYVFDHHDITPENFVAKFGRRGSVERILRFMELRSFRTADLVISTNESYRRIAIRRGGCRPEDVHVVRNGPDLRRVRPTGPNNAWRDGAKYIVGYVGAIGTQEQIDVLVDAAHYLVHELDQDDVRFIIVGRGPHLEAMRRYSESRGLSAKVIFTGYVPDAELYEILSTADVCVNPEFVNEFTDKSTMIKIMEYMAMGKPIVQFNSTEGRVSAGDSAIYVEQNDARAFARALKQLLRDESARLEMGRIGRERIENELSWQCQERKLVRAYEYLDRKRLGRG